MLQVGFHRAGLLRYTGFKSSPYTEGALFYAEKLAPGQARETISLEAEAVAEPVKEAACEPGST